jgi:predicted helicase
LKKLKELTGKMSVLIASDKIAHLEPEALRRVEEKLKLTYVTENSVEGNVCMANSSEVRDAYKDVFNSKDLQNYLYAVLNSSLSRTKYRSALKAYIFQIPFPSDQEQFWKLVRLGAQLQRIHLYDSISVEGSTKEIEAITENIDEIETEKFRGKTLQ